jgi:hypothetical protein
VPQTAAAVHLWGGENNEWCLVYLPTVMKDPHDGLVRTVPRGQEQLGQNIDLHSFAGGSILVVPTWITQKILQDVT